MDANEDCGGCVDRNGATGAKWHRRRGQQPCERAKQEERRQQRERPPRVYWTPGSPILVPEIDPL